MRGRPAELSPNALSISVRLIRLRSEPALKPTIPVEGTNE